MYIEKIKRLLPAPDCPKTKLSGLKIWPIGPDLTESMVPGSRSTKMARGTYLPPMAKIENLKQKWCKTTIKQDWVQGRLSSLSF